MSRRDEVRAALIDDMCDVGELIRRGDDLFEDMGGHLSHESNLDGHIEAYLKAMTPSERNELFKRLNGIGADDETAD